MNSDEQLVDQLEQTAPRIAQAVEGRTAVELRQRPPADPDSWAAAEIVAHLRATDDILAYRVYAILVRDNPPMPAYDEQRWTEVARYGDVAVEDSLTMFTLRRAELIRTLRHIAPADWERMGTHETYGPQTLRAAVRKLADHEAEHCAQLEALWPAPSA
jgi:hypothetical protein